MKKKVVLFSGGMDSTTMLNDAVKIYGAENIIALSLIYGQRHVREMESAKAIAEHLGVLRIEKDISTVFEYAKNPLLGHIDLPRGTYLDQIKAAGGKVPTYVPFRNGLMISIASAIALSLDADTIFYGAHADDAAGNAYPDCTPEFYKGMEEAVYKGSGDELQLVAPFQYKTKPEIALHGIQEGAPLHLSWSCYEGGKYHCGTCATCIDRKAAFESNGYTDPVVYLPEGAEF